MQVFIVCEKSGSTLAPVGIATSEARSKAKLTDGDYLIIPVQTDVYYGTGMISAAATGAIAYTPATNGLEAKITALIEQIIAFKDNLSQEIATLRTEATAAIQADRARLDALEAAAAGE